MGKLKMKRLRKFLNNLTSHNSYFRKDSLFNKFVPQILSSPDTSIPIRSLLFCQQKVNIGIIVRLFAYYLEIKFKS
ncbi:hypothetical protein TanjilG_20115 [Lupinus angustifolius]|uniref:Uncharacterized protein n=1 Tax=Lupinus angustifolius TaxID=3871 RepID=A0A4P1RCE2_LUPAN|nr:hypothetical protein TanjilG_20115 [Lupinus angustifolius]